MARSRHRSGTGSMPTKPHRASDYLKSPEDAAAYLSAAVEEMGDDPRLLMKALRNVAAAQGGIAEVAREADVLRHLEDSIRENEELGKLLAQ